MKKEKEKEPEKAEKLEMSMLRKKGFEEEKKDSDDSDDVRVPFTGRRESSSCWCDSNFVFCFSFLWTGHQSRRPKTLQEKAAQDEQADCGWTQTGANSKHFVFFPFAAVNFSPLSCSE